MKFLLIAGLFGGLATAAAQTSPATTAGIPSCAAQCVDGLFQQAGCKAADWACLCKDTNIMRNSLSACGQKCTSTDDQSTTLEAANTQCQNALSETNGNGSSSSSSSASTTSTATGSSSKSSSTATGTSSSSSASASSKSDANALAGYSMGFMVAVGLAAVLAA